MPAADTTSAKFAVLASPAVQAGFVSTQSKSQPSTVETLTIGLGNGGTPDAKAEIVLNPTASTNSDGTTAALPANGSSVDDFVEDISRPASGNRGRQREDAAQASMMASAASSATATIGEAGAPLPVSAPGGSTAAMESLFESAWRIGEGLRPDGHGELELRVRLGGDQEDIVVRVHVASERVHVSFETKSPALRQALEQGWKRFSPGGAQPSSHSPVAVSSESGRQSSGRPVSPVNSGSNLSQRSNYPPAGHPTLVAASERPGRWSGQA